MDTGDGGSSGYADRHRDGFYRRGEFARRCGVSLFTIRHYEKLGLLKPAFVNDKGYHFYGPEQSQQLSMITTCIRVGLSLYEVKELVDRNEEMSFAEFTDKLVEVRDRLARQIADLQANKRMIENTIAYGIVWNSHGIGQPFSTGGQTVQGFVSGPIDYFDPDCPMGAQMFIHRVEERIGHQIEWPQGELVDLPRDAGCGKPGGADAPGGIRHPMRFFARTDRLYADDGDFFCESYEDVLVVVHEGDRTSTYEAIGGLLDHAVRRCLEPCGPALLTKVQKYLFPVAGEQCVTVIGVPVRPCG